MRTICTFLISAIYMLAAALGATAATYTLTFAEGDFIYSTSATGELVIGTFRPDMTYPEGTAPGLPLMSVDIALPQGQTVADTRIYGTPRTVRTGVRVAIAPRSLPTDGSEDATPDPRPAYHPGTWPAEICELTGVSSYDGVDVAHFLVSPYRYDSTTGTLTFSDVIELTVDTEASGRRNAPGTTGGIGRVPAFLSSIVINPYDLPATDLSPAIVACDDTTPAAGPKKANTSASITGDQLDMVIITNTALMEAFKPWADWKRRKGIRTELAAVELIYAQYRDNRPLAIKKFLYDLYRNRGLKYVMLGGDDTIIPVRYCKVTAAGGTTDLTMPADNYYVCFGGNFEWDANGDGVYGEPDDGVDFAPWLTYTRMPVRTATHVADAFDKILRYEKGEYYSHKFLGCGKQLSQLARNDNTISDAQAFTRLLYDRAIAPYWNGTYDYLFDLDSNLGTSMRFRPDDINTVFGRGYSFINIRTHGNQTLYGAVDRQYRPADIAKLKNTGLSIITTEACITNAFDGSSTWGTADPCQSEAFIRTKATGIVAYLGCSRYGWYWNNGGTNLGPSAQYEQSYYTRLYRPDGGAKNWGELVAAAKAEKISSCKDNGSMRWIQMGLNPVGDPEMPVYIADPKTMSVKLNTVNNIPLLTISEDGCRVCVMSANDNGSEYYRVYENVNTVQLTDVNNIGKMNITVTKPGFRPVLIDHGNFGISSIDRARWMSTLPDDAYLCRLSIPGTHDSATGNGWAGFPGALAGPSTGTTQDLTIADQLKAGVRALDLRPSLENGNVIIFHGILETNLWFDAALRNIRDFLRENPTETVMVTIRHETDNDDGSADWAPKVAAILKQYDSYIAQFKPDIKLGEARGKMLILCRDKVDYSKAVMVSSWGDNQTYRAAKGTVSGKTFTIHLQDKYNCKDALDAKKTAICDLLNRASEMGRNRSTVGQWVINHASGYTSAGSSSNNKSTAGETAKAIISYMNIVNPGAMGMVMMDYAGTCGYNGTKLVDAIIDNNAHYDHTTPTIEKPVILQTPVGGSVKVPMLSAYLPYTDELTPNAKIHVGAWRDGELVWNVTDTQGTLTRDPMAADGYDIIAAYTEVPGYGESELVVLPASGKEKLPTPTIESEGTQLKGGEILAPGSKITIKHRKTRYDLP